MRILSAATERETGGEAKREWESWKFSAHVTVFQVWVNTVRVNFVCQRIFSFCVCECLCRCPLTGVCHTEWGQCKQEDVLEINMPLKWSCKSRDEWKVSERRGHMKDREEKRGEEKRGEGREGRWQSPWVGVNEATLAISQRQRLFYYLASQWTVIWSN